MTGPRWRALVCAALAVAWAFAPVQSEAEKDLKSKDPEKRIAAVEALRVAGGEAAEKALTSALLDKDWEVVELAARALGDVGSKAAFPQLVKTAIDAPAYRIRAAAAASLAKLDAARAAEDLAKLAGGKSAREAWEALSIVGPKAGGAAADSLSKSFSKAVKGKDRGEKVAAMSALAALPPEMQSEQLGVVLGSDDVELAAAALASIAAAPRPEHLRALLETLQKPRLDDVLERRAIASFAASAGALMAAGEQAGGDVGGALSALPRTLELAFGGSDAEVAARGQRLAAALARVEVDGKKPFAEAAATVLSRGTQHVDSRVRSAALHAGAELNDAAVLKAARDLATVDENARVRLIAVRSLAERVGPADADVFKLLWDRLAKDVDPLVREEAAVALGRVTTEESARALEPAIRDREWTVACVAAVSLGKTLQQSAVSPLAAMAKDEDWKRRGAAVLGLCHVSQPEAMPQILASLGDPEPLIRRTAWLYAKSLTRESLPEEAAPWQAWWREHGAKVRFPNPEEQKKRREKYGYAQSDAEVFRDLDVVVLDSRGDHIQKILDHVGIAFRLTAAAKHPADALHSSAVYVSNCTGEVEDVDIERIAWFLRCGGYFFGSCWSLHETLEKAYPGVVKKLETPGEVIDTVLAEACAPDSPYLKGVFEGGMRPHYALVGAHLIEVIDRERTHVLVDSPQCATRWGGGNLAVWFRAGHGLVLDSVNHFENQGLVEATQLKEAEQRQAYAIDHMGMSYGVWRATKDEKWWGSNAKAAERVFDLSALRLVTNFVRSKRLEEL